MASLNLRETELCLGLPGGGGDSGVAVETAATPKASSGIKRAFSATVDLKLNLADDTKDDAGEDVTNNNVQDHKKNAMASSKKDLTKPPAK